MVIVTGGAGFIGSYFIRYLNANSVYDIIVVDNLSDGVKWKNLSNKCISQYIDKSDFRKMINSVSQYNDFLNCDTVVHLGACSDTTNNDLNYLMDNNFNYSKDILQWAMEHNMRFIYASSAATYGDGSSGYSDKSVDFLVPMNPYGFSKHLFDMFIINNKLDQYACGLKFFNVFGPNEYHKKDMRSMVIKSVEQIKEKGYINLFKSTHPDYPDGGQMRDFIYVKDCCRIMMKVLADRNWNGIYNIGTGKPRTWNDLAKSVFSAMGLKSDIRYIDMPSGLTSQYQNYTAADISKLMSRLGQFEFTSLEDSVSDYVNNYILTNKIF